jgi:putative permease
MIAFLRQWFIRYLSHPQAALLFMFLLLGFGCVYLFGGTLAPIVAGLVIAYLLEGLVRKLVFARLPRRPAVLLVFLIFLGFLVFLLVGLLPLLSAQITRFFDALPGIANEWQAVFMKLPARYPQLLSPEHANQIVTEVTGVIRDGIAALGQKALSFSLASITSLLTLLVYLFVMPVAVFFFLKDKEPIVRWFLHFLPRDRDILASVWTEMDAQIGNYVRGKFAEVLVVTLATYIAFSLMHLTFAVLLSVMAGLSVIVPYVGFAVVTLPVAIAGYLQMGWTADYAWFLVAYTVIQAIDGYILVPLLFSKANSLHPIAILVAVLFFGGLWGFWGVFFAIPLATLVKALLDVWPQARTVYDLDQAEGVDPG